MRILAVETSCDDTAVAVLDADNTAMISRVNLIWSQHAVHADFGGIVPEIASREHLDQLALALTTALAPLGNFKAALASIDAFAVTCGPGLLGSLLVGVQWVKGLSFSCRRPFIGINHLEGHLAASWLLAEPPPLPYVALIASGGHTQLIDVAAWGHYTLLGTTLDDAAGEAFDKVAKMLDLGYPGGKVIEEASCGGDNHAFSLTRPLWRQGLNFSFSGLKTQSWQIIQAQKKPLSSSFVTNFCASVQQAINDVLIDKLFVAAKQQQRRCVVLGGGVAANQALRTQIVAQAATQDIAVFVPPKNLCTDNALMIAAAAWQRLRYGLCDDFTISPLARWPLNTLVYEKNLKIC